MSSTYVSIESGVSDWQIFQQENGFGRIEVKGKKVIENNTNPVWVRICDEQDNSVVIDWAPAEMNGNDFSITVTVPAGGLYKLETVVAPGLSSIDWQPRGDFRHHIGVGDIFVITGQSNASGYGKTPAFDPPELGVHLFKNSYRWDLAAHPISDGTDAVETTNAEGCNAGTSPYLSFGRTMKKHLGYPIGLIFTAQGGSPIGAWLPEGNLNRHMKTACIEATGGAKKVAGILWYQGCSNTAENETSGSKYLSDFKCYVEDMRSFFDNEKLPVYTCQLNKHESRNTSAEGYSNVRESQRLAAIQVPHTYVCPTYDLSMSDGIHNSSASNVVLGERIARCALQNEYGKQIYGNAPDVISAVSNEKSLEISFSNVHHYISTISDDVTKLQININDDNGIIPVEKYSCSRNTLYITMARSIIGSGTVSYASGASISSNIIMDYGSGLPALAFHKFPITRKV